MIQLLAFVALFLIGRHFWKKHAVKFAYSKTNPNKVILTFKTFKDNVPTEHTYEFNI